MRLLKARPCGFPAPAGKVCHIADVKPKGGWGMAIRTITLTELDRLSVDDGTGRLFWDGKEVVTTLSLPWIVNVALIVGALAALIAALWPIIRFYRYGS